MSPTLEYHPEKSRDLRARFPQALTPICREGGYLPDKDPKHIFDYEDGIRLIISQDECADGDGTFIHLSISVDPDSLVAERYAGMVESVGQSCAPVSPVMEQMIRDGVQRFSRLSGYCGDVHVVMVSARGVPHLAVKSADWKEEGHALETD